MSDLTTTKTFYTLNKKEFTISCNHIIFYDGIFNNMETNTTIPFHSDDFRYFVYREIIPKELLTRLLFLVLPISNKKLENVFIKKIIKCLEKDLKDLTVVNLPDNLKTYLVEFIQIKYDEIIPCYSKFSEDFRDYLIYDYHLIKNINPNFFYKDNLVKYHHFSKNIFSILKQYYYQSLEDEEVITHIVKNIDKECLIELDILNQYTITMLECFLNNGILFLDDPTWKTIILENCTFPVIERMLEIVEYKVEISRATLGSLLNYFPNKKMYFFDHFESLRNNSILLKTLFTDLSNEEDLQRVFEKVDFQSSLNQWSFILSCCKNIRAENIRNKALSIICIEGISFGNDYEDEGPIHIISSISLPNMKLPNMKDIIIKYIENGIDIEKETKSGQRPILNIVKYQSNEVMELFLNHCKYIDCEPLNDGHSPFHWICKKGSPELIMKMIEKGADLEKPCISLCGYIKYRPIHFICEYSSVEMLLYMIKMGVNCLDIKTILEKRDASYIKELLKSNTNLPRGDSRFFQKLVHKFNQFDLETTKLVFEKYGNDRYILEYYAKSYNILPKSIRDFVIVQLLNSKMIKAKFSLK